MLYSLCTKDAVIRWTDKQNKKHERDGEVSVGENPITLWVGLVTGDHAVGQLVKKMMRLLWNLKKLLPSPKQPVNKPYSEPAVSNPHSETIIQTLPIYDNPLYSKAFQMVSFLLYIRSKFTDLSSSSMQHIYIYNITDHFHF